MRGGVAIGAPPHGEGAGELIVTEFGHNCEEVLQGTFALASAHQLMAPVEMSASPAAMLVVLVAWVAAFDFKPEQAQRGPPALWRWQAPMLPQQVTPARSC